MSLLAPFGKQILELVIASLNYLYLVISFSCFDCISVVFGAELCETKRPTVATLESRVISYLSV